MLSLFFESMEPLSITGLSVVAERRRCFVVDYQIWQRLLFWLAVWHCQVQDLLYWRPLQAFQSYYQGLVRRIT